MSDKIQNIIDQLENNQSDFFKSISNGIKSMYNFKYTFYSKTLDDYNKQIIDVEQPKFLMSLCSNDMYKQVIEFKSLKDNRYKSFDIIDKILYDINSNKELKLNKKSNILDYGVNAINLNLFKSDTQCEGKPKTLKLKNFDNTNLESNIDKDENKSYFEIVKKRNKLLGFLSFIKDSIQKMDEKDINFRVDQLKQSLDKFNKNIIGSARENIKIDIFNFIVSFSNNWMLYTEQYLNFVLTGPPGSGKTTIAKYLGEIMKNLGILIVGNLTTESRATIVGQYIGQTADKVRNILVDNLESVIFIDEAYSIAQSGNEGKYDEYGVEALNEIVGFLDKHKGQICIISAGYKKEIEEFWFAPNPGLKRRTPYIWELKNYTSQDLWNILRNKINQKLYLFSILQSDNNFSTVLDSSRTGIYIYNLIQYFNDPEKCIFINQSGDMELLASELMNLFFLKQNRLTVTDIGNIFYYFLKNRNDILKLYDVNKLKENIKQINRKIPIKPTKFITSEEELKTLNPDEYYINFSSYDNNTFPKLQYVLENIIPNLEISQDEKQDEIDQTKFHKKRKFLKIDNTDNIYKLVNDFIQSDSKSDISIKEKLICLLNRYNVNQKEDIETLLSNLRDEQITPDNFIKVLKKLSDYYDNEDFDISQLNLNADCKAQQQKTRTPIRYSFK